MTGFEQSPFGDGSATGSGNVTTAVNTHFGVRDSSQAQGKVKTEGVANEIRVEFLGADLNDGTFALLNPVIPAGAIIEEAYLKVTTAITLTGTSPTILIGTNGSEVTNGFVGTEAQSEAVATYDLTSTLTGTWAAPLAAETTVGISLGGTSSPTATGGKAEVVIRYAIV